MLIRSPVALGAAIRDRRRSLGWDQSELARKVGVGRQWVVAVEKGNPGAQLGHVLRALVALDLSLALEPRHASKQKHRSVPDDGRDIDLDAIIRARRSPR